MTPETQQLDLVISTRLDADLAQRSRGTLRRIGTPLPPG
jgi:hypothetical protein